MQRSVYKRGLSHSTLEQQRELVHRGGSAVHRLYGKGIPGRSFTNLPEEVSSYGDHSKTYRDRPDDED